MNSVTCVMKINIVVELYTKFGNLIYLAFETMDLFIYNILVGYCTEYNTGGAVVQPHYELKCSDVNPPCKTSYNSTDAYLCKRLFY